MGQKYDSINSIECFEVLKMITGGVAVTSTDISKVMEKFYNKKKSQPSVAEQMSSLLADGLIQRKEKRTRSVPYMVNRKGIVKETIKIWQKNYAKDDKLKKAEIYKQYKLILNKIQDNEDFAEFLIKSVYFSVENKITFKEFMIKMQTYYIPSFIKKKKLPEEVERLKRSELYKLLEESSFLTSVIKLEFNPVSLYFHEKRMGND